MILRKKKSVDILFKEFNLIDIKYAIKYITITFIEILELIHLWIYIMYKMKIPLIFCTLVNFD